MKWDDNSSETDDLKAIVLLVKDRRYSTFCILSECMLRTGKFPSTRLAYTGGCPTGYRDGGKSSLLSILSVMWTGKGRGSKA